jgi:hypothetical protein
LPSHRLTAPSRSFGGARPAIIQNNPLLFLPFTRINFFDRLVNSSANATLFYGRLSAFQTTGMIKLFSFICVAVLLLSVTGCKKENLGDSIQGSWELNRIIGMVAIDTPMHNHTIRFAGNHYEYAFNGQVTKSGQYEIVKDLTAPQATCSDAEANQYSYRIIFDNNTAYTKMFIKLSDNTLSLRSGCFYNDGGILEEYTRQ